MVGILFWLLMQEPCTVSQPTATVPVGYRKKVPELNTDPNSPLWKKAHVAWMSKDCLKVIDYADLRTEIRAVWTNDDLFLLFICPYRTLNVFLPADNSKPRRGLWDRDVVEMFFGDDWQNIRHYREFEIAPTADWIDLTIDLDHRGAGRGWKSGWQTIARIDESKKTWYAACRIPLKSVSEKEIKPGTKWRANLYRIDGEGPDSQRRFMCWQPTCVLNRDPNHVPENFGTLVFTK
jgi:hypothetical protein